MVENILTSEKAKTMSIDDVYSTLSTNNKGLDESEVKSN